MSERNLRLAILLIAGLLVFAPRAEAQRASRLPTAPDDVRSALADGESASQSGNWAEAIERFQQVLDHREDYFSPDGGSLKSRVEELLRQLPPEGLAAYERRFGATARGLLEEAVKGGSADGQRDVVRQYFYTEAGRDAALAIAERQADGGDMLAAARLYDRIAGHPALPRTQRGAVLLRAAVAWWIAGTGEVAQVRLAERQSGATPSTQPAVPADPVAALEWLSAAVPTPDATPDAAEYHVSVFRGNPQRNAGTAPAAPVGPFDWQYPTIDLYDTWYAERIPELESRINSLQRRLSDRDGPERLMLPAGVPLVANGIVVVHGPGSVKAVSLRTGELLWSTTHVDQTFKHLVDDRWEADEEWHKGNLDLFLAQRTWRDLTSASLSTDGTYVYAVFDGGMVSSISQAALNVPDLATHPLAPHPYNQLVAIELQHGRMKWTAGGPSGPYQDELAGVYFLGAPLPIDGKLYCLVEDRGQVRLVVLDAARAAADHLRPGRAMIWSQALYNPDVNLSNAWLGTERRMAGLSPSADGDILICPTGETTVVAVDIARRTLLWTEQYREPTAGSPQQALAVRMMLARQQQRGRMEDQLAEELLRPDHWADSAAVIAGQRVLLTPPDASDLICLNLLDGSEVWRRPRGERRFLAGVYNDQVLIVGSRHVEALQLATGEPAWESSIPISGPGGRGFRHGQYYVLPLVTGEVITIDLQQQRMIASSRVDFEGGPGNLVAADGRILCQTSASVSAFPQLDQLRLSSDAALAANPDDPEALATRGELSLHLGDEASALADLRRSLATADLPRTRELLVAALLEGLRSDFPAYRGAADEVESLVTSEEERRRFHRLYAEGLQEAGEVQAAFRQYLEFAESMAGSTELERVESGRSVRIDRWSRGRLEALWQSADDLQRQQLQRELHAVIDEAVRSDDVIRLAGLLSVAPDRASVDRLRYEWARRVDVPADFPLLETRLLQLRRSGTPEYAAYGTARLADIWLDQHQTFPMLYQLLEELSGPLAAVDCLRGNTGAELVAQWTADSQRAPLMTAPQLWPAGHVELNEEPRIAGAGLSFIVPHLGTPSEALRGWRFFTDAQGTNLIAYDQQGRRMWHLPSGTLGNRRGRSSEYIRYVMTHGRLLLIAVEDQFTIVDALSGGQTAVVLANEQLSPNADQSPFSINIQRANVIQRLRNRVWMDPQDGTKPLGNMGPLNADGFVFQVGETLKCIDPLTGRPLWTHEVAGLDPGGEILADEDFIVIWPGNSSRPLRVFRTADGEDLGARPVPQSAVKPQPDGHWGRRIVLHEVSAAGSMRLGVHDPSLDQVVWKREFAGAVHWSVVDGVDFAVLLDDGTLHIVSGASGEDLAIVSLPADPPPESVTVVGDPQRYFVMTYVPPQDGGRVVDGPTRAMPHVHGLVAAVDRQTAEIIWSQPVTHQQYLSDTPGGWPVLAFAAQVFDPNPGDNAAARRYWGLKFLNKDDGGIVYESEVNGRQDKYGWESHPDRHELAVAAGSARVALKFTAAPPAQAEPPSEP